VEGILGVVRRTAERVEKHVEQIGTTSEAILDVTKQQLARVDELLSEATTRAKVQMERAEMVLDDTMTRVQETVSHVQSGVMRPVREVYGVMAGIRTALARLGRGGRPTVDHATSDEEMFI
jgi:methyl-accepting chemotaxis protein